jgi:signal transduction histidine kinase
VLDSFIRDNRQELIARARARVMERRAPRATQVEIDRGVPLFLTQLAALLERTMTHGEESAVRLALGEEAAMHGRRLSAEGLGIAQVVHDYGDVCQVITELAVERNAPIDAGEFRAFNRCLDDAIAGAVAEFSRTRESAILEAGTERLGVLAHELRNLIHTAMLSFDTIRRGVAGTGGSVGEIHARTLRSLRDLVDRSLTEVRLDADVVKLVSVNLAEFIEEAEVHATLQAGESDVALSIPAVDPSLFVSIDRQVLAGALANLLQNAFKFTRRRGSVTLCAHATAERVLIDVEDECGGLPEGKTDGLFALYEQRGKNREGLGLGLAIARRAVEANGGVLRVRDLTPVGCRFTIDVPIGSKPA